MDLALLPSSGKLIQGLRIALFNGSIIIGPLLLFSEGGNRISFRTVTFLVRRVSETCVVPTVFHSDVLFYILSCDMCQLGNNHQQLLDRN